MRRTSSTCSPWSNISHLQQLRPQGWCNVLGFYFSRVRHKQRDSPHRLSEGCFLLVFLLFFCSVDHLHLCFFRASERCSWIDQPGSGRIRPCVRDPARGRVHVPAAPGATQLPDGGIPGCKRTLPYSEKCYCGRFTERRNQYQIYTCPPTPHVPPGSEPPGEGCDEQRAPAWSRPSTDHTRLRKSCPQTANIWADPPSLIRRMLSSGSDSPGPVLLCRRPPLHRPAAAVSSPIPHSGREWRRPPPHCGAGRE